MGADRVSAELVGAAAAAVDAERREAAGEQLELMAPKSDRLSVEEARTEGEARRGRGRPRGAANVATRELRDILAMPGHDPVRRLVAWGSMEPEELARRLGISTEAAFDRLSRIWETLAPYRLPKLAPTDESGRAVPSIGVFIGGHQSGGDDRPPWMRMVGDAGNDIVELQALSSTALPNANANPEGEDE